MFRQLYDEDVDDDDSTVWFILFVDRVAIDSLLIDASRQPAADADVMERRRRIITTLVWFITTLLIALFIPDIGVVISLLGGLAAIFIFVFPGQNCCFIWSVRSAV